MSVSQHQATDAYLGYVHQGHYALVVLLDAGDDAAVSVETGDDVELTGTTPTLHQLKHSLDPSTPLTVKNVGLWKTIRIWAQDPSRFGTTAFVFVTCSRLEPTSPLAALIGTGTDKAFVLEALRAEAKRVVDEVEQAEANGRTPLPHREKLPGCKAFHELSAPQQAALVQQMIVRPESFNAQQLPSQLSKRLDRIVLKEKRDALYERLIEWWDRQVALSLLRKRARPIYKAELQNKLYSLIVELGDEALTDDYSWQKPQPDELEAELGSIMEKQIHLVKGGYHRISRAAQARWQARNQRDLWMKQNLASAALLDEFDQRLVDEWRDLYGPLCDDTQGESEDELCKAGCGLLDWTHQEAPNTVIPPKPTWRHPFLVRGSYQELAEYKRVGWLPGYENHPALCDESEDA